MITVSTTIPSVLLSRIKAAIDRGSIQTWSYDSDGDFTHTPNQWVRKAWLRPVQSTSGLQFRFIAPTGGATREVFAVYQGRFQEMLVAHFPASFSVAGCTANPSGSDSAVLAA